MKVLKKAVLHFIEFHRGALNITLHIIGFAGIFYSVYKLDWVIFSISLVLLETGHIYNHFAGIKPYDFRLKVTLWRIFLFLLLVGVFYGIISILP